MRGLGLHYSKKWTVTYFMFSDIKTPLNRSEVIQVVILLQKKADKRGVYREVIEEVYIQPHPLDTLTSCQPHP